MSMMSLFTPEYFLVDTLSLICLFIYEFNNFFRVGCGRLQIMACLGGIWHNLQIWGEATCETLFKVIVNACMLRGWGVGGVEVLTKCELGWVVRSGWCGMGSMAEGRYVVEIKA